MDLTFYLTIALGLICPFAWLIKNETTFRVVCAIIPFCWAVLNYTQGLVDSALILFVISLRAMTGLYLMNHSLRTKTFFSSIFIVFFTAMLVKGYEDMYSLLPWFAACLTTVAQIYLSGIALRMTQSFGADGAWIAYDIARSAWGHLFEKSFSVALNIWTVRKMVEEENLASKLTKLGRPDNTEGVQNDVMGAGKALS